MTLVTTQACFKANSTKHEDELDTYLLENDAPTGPFRLISYMAGFGPQAYFFVNCVSKFWGFGAPAATNCGSEPTGILA